MDTSHNTAKEILCSIVKDLIDGYQTRDDVSSRPCMTKILTNTARQEAYTVTENWAYPGAAKAFAVLAVMTCQHTGLPIVAVAAWEHERDQDL
jgi:hypothetical protein